MAGQHALARAHSSHAVMRRASPHERDEGKANSHQEESGGFPTKVPELAQRGFLTVSAGTAAEESRRCCSPLPVFVPFGGAGPDVVSGNREAPALLSGPAFTELRSADRYESYHHDGPCQTPKSWIPQPPHPHWEWVRAFAR